MGGEDICSWTKKGKGSCSRNFHPQKDAEPLVVYTHAHVMPLKISKTIRYKANGEYHSTTKYQDGLQLYTKIADEKGIAHYTFQRECYKLAKEKKMELEKASLLEKEKKEKEEKKEKTLSDFTFQDLYNEMEKAKTFEWDGELNWIDNFPLVSAVTYSHSYVYNLIGKNRNARLYLKNDYEKHQQKMLDICNGNPQEKKA